MKIEKQNELAIFEEILKLLVNINNQIKNLKISTINVKNSNNVFIAENDSNINLKKEK